MPDNTLYLNNLYDYFYCPVYFWHLIHELDEVAERLIEAGKFDQKYYYSGDSEPSSDLLETTEMLATMAKEEIETTFDKRAYAVACKEWNSVSIVRELKKSKNLGWVVVQRVNRDYSMISKFFRVAFATQIKALREWDLDVCSAVLVTPTDKLQFELTPEAEREVAAYLDHIRDIIGGKFPTSGNMSSCAKCPLYPCSVVMDQLEKSPLNDSCGEVADILI